MIIFFFPEERFQMFFEVSSLYAELISRDQWLLKVTFVIQLTKRDIALSLGKLDLLLS